MSPIDNEHALACRGIVIAAPSSGSGKTLLTLGLLRALRDRGKNVVSAKIGPDYIDPAFHASASGEACLNIDPWAMRRTLREQVVVGLCHDKELIVCEGVMGLFDGATARDGSTADIAAENGWPVVLIVDARSQAASAAAVVLGFVKMRNDVKIGGVIFNRIGSDRHMDVIKNAMAYYAPDTPVFGYLPRVENLELPSRHLGLVQAIEHEGLDSFINQAAAHINEHVDLDALMAIACPPQLPMDSHSGQLALSLPPLGQRIAVAKDEAFAFAYPHVLNGWRENGAEIRFFSPLADQEPWPDADAVYLPGGYPELHAGALSSGSVFLPGLHRAADNKTAIFGECGGYMVLGEGLIDADGNRHTMAGLLPLETSFAERKLHLGYRQVELANGQSINGGLTASQYRGHEFHYAKTIREGDAAPLFRISDAAGNDLGTSGLCVGSVAGSFIHLVDQWS